MTRILLIDDSIDILESLSLVLEEKYEVVAVSSGEDALVLTEQQRFDVILVDLMMPILDGATFIRMLREGGNRTPVVLMSASVDLPERSETLGVVTLAKPFEPDRLLRVLDAALAPRRSTRPRGAPGLTLDLEKTAATT